MNSFELSNSEKDKWLIRSVHHLIRITEKRICRNGSRHSLSEATGYALSRQRAAAFVFESNVIDPHLPLVCHAAKSSDDRLNIQLPFELYASNAQEAVNHCIYAHEIAARLNTPGLCSIDAELSEQYQYVKLPSNAMIEALSPIHDTDSNELTESQIVEIIQDVFNQFNQKFDTAEKIIYSDEILPNGICFIAKGKFAEDARRFAQVMRQHNIAASSICLALVKPFPNQMISKLIASQKLVIVIDDDPSSEQSPMVSGVREIISELSDNPPSVRYLNPLSDLSWKTLTQKLLSFNIDLNILRDSLPTPTDQGKSFIIGTAPNGQMSQMLLLDLATYLAQTNGYGIFNVNSPHERMCTLGFTQTPSTHPTIPKQVDILFLSHPGLIDIEDIIDHVTPKGIILVLGRSVEEDSIWPLFTTKMQNQINDKDIKLFTLSNEITDEYTVDDRYGTYAVHGALLSLVEQYSHEQIHFETLQHSGILTPEAYQHLETGRQSIRPVDRTIQRHKEFDPYFEPQIQLPRMLPSVTTKSKSSDWRASVRNFFIKGQSSDAQNHPLPGLSIRPALLNPYLEALSREHFYPLLATRIKGNPELQVERLDSTLKQILNNLSGDHDEFISHFVKLAEDTANEILLITSAKKILSDTLDKLRPDLVDDTVENAIHSYIATLPDECYLIGLNPHTLLDLYVLSVRAARRSRMRDVRSEIRGLITQLRDALRVDDAYGPYGTSASALSDAFGPAASELINTSAIAKDLQTSNKGHKQHDPERIERMTESLHKLEAFVTTLSSSIDLIFAYAPDIQVKSSYDRVKIVCHKEPIAIASGIFDAISQQMTDAFKAMRMARLDLDNAYDPDYHGDILEHFTWQDLSEDELRLMPVICIAETTERLYDQLTPLSRLIRSGKPLDVLVFESTAKAMSTNPYHNQTDYDPGFSYMATAYREAFVAQSTLARPEHLVSNLNRMNRLLRPAVNVVACPAWSWRLPARVQLEAAHHGRTAPVFQYDPSIGETRVERFSVKGNPQPDQLWPTCEFKYVDENGQIQTMEGTFTFAHALALEPGYHQYFRILPNDAWNDELIEIGEFLKNPTFDKPHIPYIWGVIDSTLRKCIMTRDVANACIDRMQRWKTLRELSMSTQAQLQIANDSRERKHVEALEASQRMTDEVSSRLASSHDMLRKMAQTLVECLQTIQTELGESSDNIPDLNEAMRDETSFIEGLVGDSPVEISPTNTSQNTTQDIEKQELSLHSNQNPSHKNPETPAPKLPRIESDRCLSCGACVDLNDKLFGFNEDGQAILLNPDATIDDVREASQTCPASCIIIE